MKQTKSTFRHGEQRFRGKRCAIIHLPTQLERDTLLTLLWMTPAEIQIVEGAAK